MSIGRSPVLNLLLGIFCASGLTGCHYWPGLPDVSILRTRYPVVHYVPRSSPSSYVTFERARPSSWVGLDDVSRSAVGAIIVSEDWAFYQHKGYDPKQIKEALNHDIARGRFARGASTITQQVAKNLFLDTDKNVIRKLKELALAIRLEKKYKKRKILEIYLNIAEWGEGIYGIGPAARFYFKKSPRELTAKEGAFLAMLLPSPKRYSQSFRAKSLTVFARRRIADILGKMSQAHYITDGEKIAEKAKFLSFEMPSAEPFEGNEDSEDP